MNTKVLVVVIAFLFFLIFQEGFGVSLWKNRKNDPQEDTYLRGNQLGLNTTFAKIQLLFKERRHQNSPSKPEREQMQQVSDHHKEILAPLLLPDKQESEIHTAESITDSHNELQDQQKPQKTDQHQGIPALVVMSDKQGTEGVSADSHTTVWPEKGAARSEEQNNSRSRSTDGNLINSVRHILTKQLSNARSNLQPGRSGKDALARQVGDLDSMQKNRTEEQEHIYRKDRRALKDEGNSPENEFDAESTMGDRNTSRFMVQRKVAKHKQTKEIISYGRGTEGKRIPRSIHGRHRQYHTKRGRFNSTQ